MNNSTSSTTDTLSPPNTDIIVNKVASSGLVSLDLEDLWPREPRFIYDLAQHLWQGLVLRETEFRDALKNIDWSAFAGQHVAITCSEDAIVPTWAYMLLATKLQPVAASVCFGNYDTIPDTQNEYLMLEAIRRLDLSAYHGAKVVVKGCSGVPMPTSAYVELVTRLQPHVQSLMFGEPCSTVPLYKRPKV